LQLLIRSLEYIKYRWIAKGRHGIHSPFVYSYTDVCLKLSLSVDGQNHINELTRSLRNNDQVITISDFGAGSRKMGNERKISAIFKNSSSHGTYGTLLYQIAKHYKPSTVLEFGTSLGVGTTYLALGNPSAQITTLEACKETRKCALQHLGENDKIESILSTFDEYLNTKLEREFDLVFVDGHHDGDALLDYMDRLSSITNDETIFILDDIRWSNSMFDAWQQIINDDQYHLTIDHFRVGIVSRRPSQEKEHFTLKV
jgi:predicted O-methyltransferase YrrM